MKPRIKNNNQTNNQMNNFDLQNSLIKASSRVIDKKLTALKEILYQDNLNMLVCQIDEHFTDFQTCADLEETIFCLESYLNRRGIGGILTKIPEEMTPFMLNANLSGNVTLRGRTDDIKQTTGSLNFPFVFDCYIREFWFLSGEG
jgi:hypothetical protein